MFPKSDIFSSARKNLFLNNMFFFYRILKYLFSLIPLQYVYNTVHIVLYVCIVNTSSAKVSHCLVS